MNMYPAICKVNLIWWDEETQNNHRETKVVLVTCSSFGDAASQIEKYYADELESVDIELFADGMLVFPEEMYDSLKAVMEDYI